MTQAEQVAASLREGLKSIQEIFSHTGILRPNIRRILGQGAKAGKFSRVAKGVYVLKQGEEQIAWIECGNAVEVLRDLVEAGEKYDMVFLDPAYFSPNLIGGNRLKGGDWFPFITPRDFYRVMESVRKLVRNENTHVYLMLSAAPGSWKDMLPYLQATQLNGFKVAGEGAYLKTYANGKPVIALHGDEAAPEKLYLLNLSGKAENVTLDFSFPRPEVRTAYRTEKNRFFLRRLIEQSTEIMGHILDCFFGSGNLGAEAVRMGRKITGIDISMKAIEDYCCKKFIGVC